MPYLITEQQLAHSNHGVREQTIHERNLLGRRIYVQASTGAEYEGYYIGLAPRGGAQIRVTEIYRYGIAEGLGKNNDDQGRRTFNFESLQLMEPHYEEQREEREILGRKVTVHNQEGETFFGIVCSQFGEDNQLMDVRPKGGSLRDLSGHLHNVPDVGNNPQFRKTRVVLMEEIIAFHAE